MKQLILSGPEEYGLHYFIVPKLDLKSCKHLPGGGTEDLIDEQVMEIMDYKTKLVTSGLPDPVITSYKRTVVNFADPRPRTLAILKYVYESGLIEVKAMYLNIQEPEHQLNQEDNSDIVKHTDMTLPNPIYPVNHVLRSTNREMNIVFHGYNALELICNIPGIQEKTNATFDFHNPNSVFTPKGLKDILQIIADDLPDDVELPGLIPPSQIRIKAREILDTNHQSCIEMLRLLGELHAQ
jgi:hypothetical protein